MTARSERDEYDLFVRRMDDAFAAATRPPYEEVHELLADVASSGAIRNLLAGARAAVREGSACTGSSLFHPNGFHRFSLHRRTPESASLRLHVWNGDSDDEPAIHDHRWSFASLVLEGELAAVNFRVTETPSDSAGVYHRVVMSDLAADGSKSWNSDGVVSLELDSAYVLGPGQQHALDYRRPHRVALRSARAASLVVAFPPSRGHSHGFRPHLEAIDSRSYATYDRPTVVAHIDAYIDAFPAAQGETR